ncbi:MAG TPA: GGDEF domain-containing response regulator [Rhizomicrobium sp.]|jgi:diguanylate cyclase (GGDEF)-like protein
MSQTIKILSVEDDDDDAELLAFALAGAADREYQIQRARTLSEMHEVLAFFRPDVVLLDMHLPDSHGLDTVRQALIASHDAPVLVLTGKTDAEIGLKAVEAGAQDFLPKPEIMTPVLKRAIDFAIQRKGVVRATELRAATDALTGLSNRAHFIRTLDTATAHADRHCHGFALAFIDLDGFKGINDGLGHAAGDEVLITVALRMKSVARSNDHLCRLGGDEFVILLDGIVAEDQGQTAAVRYAAAIEAPITLKSGEVVQVGASLGLALCPADGRTPSALVEAADRRMYQAKAARKQKQAQARKTAS